MNFDFVKVYTRIDQKSSFCFLKINYTIAMINYIFKIINSKMIKI